MVGQDSPHEHIPTLIPFTVTTLRNMPFRSETHTETVLFMDIDRSSVDFDPIFKMAAELFTHLGIASESRH